MASQPLIHGLLIDISGTLLVGSSPTPGAAKALMMLRAARIPFRLCSNTSKESSDAVYKRMKAAGLDVHKEELWTSIGALRAVLKELKVKRPYMILSESALEELKDDSGAQNNYDASNIPSLSSSLSYDAVVIGLAPDLLDYAHLNAAFRILTGEAGEDRPRGAVSACNAKAQAQRRPVLIALHKARYLEASDHALSLGPGPFIHALEDVAGTSALVVGKPKRAFFEAVLRDLERDLDSKKSTEGKILISVNSLEMHRGLTCEQQAPPLAPAKYWEGIAIVGDDIEADLGEGAIELGLWRVLVKTGKYRQGDEQRDAIPPDHSCASFSEFVEALLEQRQKRLL